MEEHTQSSSVTKPQSSSDTKPSTLPDFAPVNPTDGRELLDWRSKYVDPSARRGIWREAYYLAGWLVAVPIGMLILWLETPKVWLAIPDPKYAPILKYGLAVLGGILGGTLFDIKWLYHSVAKQIWHEDRLLWRLFTPLISGGLAFAVVALISSGLLRIFDSKAIESRSLIIGIAFLVGYFSDSAIAKLTEIAETIFGASRARERHKDKSVLGHGLHNAEGGIEEASSRTAERTQPVNAESEESSNASNETKAN